MSSLRTLLRSIFSTSQGRSVLYHSRSSRPLPALFPCAEVPAQEHINLGAPTRPTLQRYCCSVRSSARDLVQYVLQGSKLGRKLRPKGEVAYLICCKVLLDLEVVLTCIWCCIVGRPMRVPPDLLPSEKYSDFLRKHLGDFPQGPTLCAPGCGLLCAGVAWPASVEDATCLLRACFSPCAPGA